MEKTTFGVWDYVVFSLMVVASLLIGIYHAARSRNQTTSEYLIAGGSMTCLPVALSLVASYCSSILIIGYPAEGYTNGISMVLGSFSTQTGFAIEIILILAFVKRLNISTTNEYLERRFDSRSLRILANIFSCINQLRYMSVVMYGAGIAVQTVTGLSITTSIAVTGSAAVIYTTIGGLKAVIWTDVLQFTIMTLGIFSTTIIGTVYAGGITEVWTRVAESGRLYISVDTDPTVRHTLWNLIFGSLHAGFGYLLMPAAFQRVLSMKSLSHASRSMLLTCPIFVLLLGVGTIEGMVAYAYYAKIGCDPLESKQIETPNQIVPFFILDIYRNMPGMPGFFMAALASASLSTISSCLSAMANITWYDLFKPRFPQLSEFKALLIVKATVFVFGIIGCACAFGLSMAGSHTLLQVSDSFRAVTGQMVVALFYLGAFCPFVNKKGAIAGLLTGFVIMIWLVVGSVMTPRGANSPYARFGSTDQCPANLTLFKESISSIFSTTSLYNSTDTPPVSTTPSKSGLKWFYSLSYTLFMLIGASVLFLTGIVTSLLTGGLKSQADSELVIHINDLLCWSYRRRRHRSDENLETTVNHALIQLGPNSTQTVVDA